MAHQSEGMAQTINEYYSEPNISNHPKLSRRKSSFSEALTKFTSNTFNRRRTDACLPSSTSSFSINNPSRIPTPAGVDRSASFFSTLNTFASKSTVSVSVESPQLYYTKRARKISERLAQTPFFSHQPQQQNDSTPKRSRESSIVIEHRGLMQPVHPPLPRSNTIANPSQSQRSPPHTPGFMRPTTSSARRTSTIGRTNTAAPSSMGGPGSVALQCQRNSSLRTVAGSDTPNKTPTQARRGQANPFPIRSDSLVSVPIKIGKTAPALGSDVNARRLDMPADYSDGANFQVTDQHAQEMPKDKEDENGKPKMSCDHVSQSRRAPQPKESKKGILKSNGKKSKFSEGFSNLYVDDDADGSKDGLDNDVVNSRSDQDSPSHSERTATPESSNPRLVRMFPTQCLSPCIFSSSIPDKFFFTLFFFTFQLPFSPRCHHLANASPPPDPRSPTRNMVARPLHRPLRPLPHRRPPHSSHIAVQTPLLPERLPLDQQRTLHNHGPHTGLELQREPPHARHGAPQPPRLHPSALPLHDRRGTRQLGRVQGGHGGEGEEDGGAAGEGRQGEAGVVGGVDGEEEEGGETMMMNDNGDEEESGVQCMSKVY